MDKVVKNCISQDLSGVNVSHITRGKAVVRLYADLVKYTNILDAIGANGQMVLLFPTVKDSNTSGHWIAVLYDKATRTISHFDSYGLSWRQELSYSSNGFVKQNLLGDLYNTAMQQGLKVVYSQHRLQDMRSGVNTCGRWCSLRCRFSYLTNDEFAKLFLGQTMKPDALATLMTFISITDDETYENQILKIV